MARVGGVGALNVSLEEDATQAKVAALVAKEPSALLYGVGVADAPTSGHVGNGEAFHGEAPVESLATDEDVGVSRVPVDLWSAAAAARVYFPEQRAVDGKPERGRDLWKAGQCRECSLEFCVGRGELFQQSCAVWFLVAAED